MKKITLAILMIAVTCFTYGQTTVTKTYAGPTVTVDGCGSYCVALPAVTFVAADFPAGANIIDVDVSITWQKTDGTCAAPGAGTPFHNETNFRIDGPGAGGMQILVPPGTYSGAGNPVVTTVFDQAAGGAPGPGAPVSGTFLPAGGGNLDAYNGQSALGSWILSAGDTAGADPLCVQSYSVTVTADAPPTAVCTNFTAQLDGTGNVTITGADVDGGSSDLEGPVTLSVSPSAFTCADVGSPVTVTLTVTDSAGQTDTCTAVVTVEDNVDPLIACPVDIVDVNDPGTCGRTVVYGIAFSDNCPGATLMQTAGQASGTVFPIG
ncbi:MAG: hypothetical protein HKN92_11625, partial [Chitinophagales bacterium]|nr:hypothetical protein [Chitinophagales bacterium]